MTIQKKSFSNPDSVMTPPLTRVERVKIGDFVAIKYTFEPGWKWSKDVSPFAGTATCQLHHFAIQIKGCLRIRADGGQEIDLVPGDVIDIPPGHDAWVVGDEAVDFYSFEKETDHS
jgi:hypothetical protein